MDRLDKRVAEAVDFGAELGAARMEDFMEARREMRTPKMHTSVTHDSRGSNQFKRRSRFGWLNDPQDYYLYQEEGFNHVGGWKDSEGRKRGTKRWIAGMFALRDAQAEAEDFMKREISSIVRGG